MFPRLSLRIGEASYCPASHCVTFEVIQGGRFDMACPRRLRRNVLLAGRAVECCPSPLQSSIVLSHIVDYGDGSNCRSHWLGRGKRGQRRTVAEPFVAHDVVFGRYLRVVLGMRLCFPIGL